MGTELLQNQSIGTIEEVTQIQLAPSAPTLRLLVIQDGIVDSVFEILQPSVVLHF